MHIEATAYKGYVFIIFCAISKKVIKKEEV